MFLPALQRTDPTQLLRMYGSRCKLHLNPVANKQSSSMSVCMTVVPSLSLWECVCVCMCVYVCVGGGGGGARNEAS